MAKSCDERGSRLGPLGLRAIQVLLADAEETWTLRRLASAANVPIGQVGAVFRLLERNGLVSSIGRDINRTRVVVRPGAALDWLGELERSRRPPPRLSSATIAISATDALAAFCRRVTLAGFPYAVTSATAAQLLEPDLVDGSAHVHVRVAGTARQVVRHLDLARAKSDARNSIVVEVVADPGELGTWDANDVGGLRVAQPVRVWLDLQREERYADLALRFREARLTSMPTSCGPVRALSRAR